LGKGGGSLKKPRAGHAGGARHLIEALSRRIETDAAI
jgi:hypothetical protein